MEEEEVVVDNSNTTEEVDLETTEEIESTETEESVEEVKARLAKAEELANNYKIRAEKAEKKAKETHEVTDKLSSRDIISITNAKINEDDIDEVIDYAKFKKISVTEALKVPFIKTLLADKEETRNTANASNVSNARRGVTKISDETLIANANAGKLPDNDEDIARLIEAKAKRK